MAGKMLSLCMLAGPRSHTLDAPSVKHATQCAAFTSPHLKRERVRALRVSARVLPRDSDPRSHAWDASNVQRAAQLADKSAGFTSPHPNFGCVIIVGEKVVGEGYLYAQGTISAEVQAVEAAGALCRGATAYLNMEPGDCHGENAGVKALVESGIKRVVIGIRHPLDHLRGNAIQALRGAGVQVDVLGEDLQGDTIQEVRKSCLLVNAPLTIRAAYKIPYSTLKYDMTLDGKIATASGHASGISSESSMPRLLELRGRSDAVIVGGNTLRKDNPRLTARDGSGHSPVRVVISESLDLPEEAHLWDTSEVRTIVATKTGAEKSFQKTLASKGVEVVEFKFLNPREVVDYFYKCGYLSILWECGGSGTLSASAIDSGVIHKVCAFVAPKIIGGRGAPSPVGELGIVEPTKAIVLHDVSYEQVGSDFLISGFLEPIPDLRLKVDPAFNPPESGFIPFYKTWDPYGSFSNFSPHRIEMPDEGGNHFMWSSVEHYYQAQKFYGVQDPVAQDCVLAIKSAKSPEEAARIGRKMQRQQPGLVRSDWATAKIDVMYRALKCKFSMHPHLKSILLSTAELNIVEDSPQDPFWGGGREGEGLNHMGNLLMQLREEFRRESSSAGEKSLSQLHNL